jgi:hypothetical protein
MGLHCLLELGVALLGQHSPKHSNHRLISLEQFLPILIIENGSFRKVLELVELGCLDAIQTFLFLLKKLYLSLDYVPFFARYALYIHRNIVLFVFFQLLNVALDVVELDY